MDIDIFNNIPGPTASHATKFTTAITRIPADSAVNCLRARNLGEVNMALLLNQHRDYIAALQCAGAMVTELSALPEFPDAQFVEDTALCLPGLAVMMRPGAETRRGEV
jgi:dimethylargininase